MAGGDDDQSWRDHLATEMIHDFLSRAVAAAAGEEIDLPHIVVCSDRETGAVSYSGPFPDGLTALVAAEREATLDRRGITEAPMEFSVAALLPVTA